MVRKPHLLVRMVVALGVTVATLSACGASSGGGATITADEIREQEAQGKAQEEAPQDVDETSEPAEPQQEKPKPKPKPKPAKVPSTATNADLDAYVAAGKKGLDEVFGDAFDKIYSEMDIVPVYPDGIEYDYTFRTAVDPVAARPQIEAQLPTLRTQARTVVIPEMKQQGFASPTVTYTYRNPDGSVVWSRTVS